MVFTDYRVLPNFLVVLVLRLWLRLWLRLGLGCDNNVGKGIEQVGAELCQTQQLSFGLRVSTLVGRKRGRVHFWTLFSIMSKSIPLVPFLKYR